MNSWPEGPETTKTVNPAPDNASKMSNCQSQETSQSEHANPCNKFAAPSVYDRSSSQPETGQFMTNVFHILQMPSMHDNGPSHSSRQVLSRTPVPSECPGTAASAWTSSHALSVPGPNQVLENPVSPNSPRLPPTHRRRHLHVVASPVPIRSLLGPRKPMHTCVRFRQAVLFVSFTHLECLSLWGSQGPAVVRLLRGGAAFFVLVALCFLCQQETASVKCYSF